MEGEGGGEEEASDLSKARCRQIVAASHPPCASKANGQRPREGGGEEEGLLWCWTAPRWRAEVRMAAPVSWAGEGAPDENGDHGEEEVRGGEDRRYTFPLI